MLGILQRLEDEKKPPTEREFKDALFTIEPLTRLTMESLSFEDGLDFIRSKKEFITNPIDKTGSLRLIWQAFLDRHFVHFVISNSLFLLKRKYNWSFDSVDAIYTHLWQLWTKYGSSVGDDKKYPMPLMYLPEKTPFGQEELISLYTNLSMFGVYERMNFRYKGETSVTSQILWQIQNDNIEYKWVFDGQLTTESGNSKNDRFTFADQFYDLLQYNPCQIESYYTKDIGVKTIIHPTTALNLASIPALFVNPLLSLSLLTTSGAIHKLDINAPYIWRTQTEHMKDFQKRFHHTHKIKYLKHQGDVRIIEITSRKYC